MSIFARTWPRAAAISSLILAACAVAENEAGPGRPSSGEGGSGGSAGSAGSAGIAGVAGVLGVGGFGGFGGTQGSGGTSGGGESGSGGSGVSGGSGQGGSSGAAGAGLGGAAGAAGSGGAGGTIGAGGLSTTPIFEDDFEMGSDAWTTEGGEWAVIEDGTQVLAQQSTATGSQLFVAVAGDPSWTDQAVEARVKVVDFLASSTSYFAAIFARYNPDNYYDLVLRSSDGKIAIRKNKSTLGNPVDVGIQEGVWYTLKLEVIGSTLRGYLDGQLVVTATDGSIPSGRIAVGTTVTVANFDDVKVYTR